jgi:iron(III) transport system permease protein
MLLTIVVTVLLIPYIRLTAQSNRFATISGKGYRPKTIELGPWRPLAGVGLLLLPVLVTLPILVLLWASILRFYQRPSIGALDTLTLDNYRKAFGDSSVLGALQNTLIVASVSAAAVMLIAFLAGWVVLRTRLRFRWLLDNLGALPLVFPGVVLGIAVLRTYLTLPIPIYGTIWLLVAAYIAGYMSYGMRFAETGLVQINRELEESAQVSGGSFATVARRIVAPLMMPALFGGWIYIFLLSVKEFSAAALLYGPRSRVISVAIWEQWQNGQVTEMSAFCLMVTAIFVALGLVFERFSRRFGVHV